MAQHTFTLAVSGSRTITSPAIVHQFLDESAAEIISLGLTLSLRLGDAAGVDAHALHWARINHIDRHVCFASRDKWERWRDQHVHSSTSLPLGVRSIVDARDRSAILYHLGDMESAELSAEWERDGLTMAGSKRNAAMLYGHALEGSGRADRLLAIHDGVSSGTENCIRQAAMMDIEIQYELAVL